ncbi:hypothetical protein COV82_02600 [Candidatus Peregrinibacteria bacterium CG11_big_fil_rev_8_21_14_0_20_46_8]|nr:MAG: hypothetical protein COV82_02600 [Candidatus Peregrinibacteria bacterium CG11_big_fil_rev_8_21_14_0_20_46_8]
MSRTEQNKNKFQLPPKGTQEVVLDKKTPEVTFMVGDAVVVVSHNVHDAVVMAMVARNATNDDEPKHWRMMEVPAGGLDLGAVRLQKRSSRETPGQCTVRVRVVPDAKKKKKAA